jgi:hypothetical protein
MRVDRSELVVGKIYFIDNSRRTKGVFKGKDEDTIYFDCDENSTYTRSNIEGKEHLTPFNDEGDGFDEVLIGDDLTDENLELIESILGNV